MTRPERRPRLLHAAMRHVGNGHERGGYELAGINGATGRALIIPEPAGPILSWLDGNHTLDDVAERFRALTGHELHRGALDSLIDELERLHLIEWADGPGPTGLTVDGRAIPIRLPRHEASYLGWGPMLRDNLEGLLERGPADDPAHGKMSALIAPHIDLHRGRDGYAQAYGAMAQHPPADLYVLLGTSHQAAREHFVATERTFRTPFGDLHVDHDVLAALKADVGDRLMREERLHDAEHSLEFQALFVAFRHRLADLAMPRILPILCAGFYRHMMRGVRPITDPLFHRFVTSLRRHLLTYPGRVCVIGGVDLAHKGPQFGDDRGLDVRARRTLRRRDLDTMAAACDLDAEAYWDDVTADRNARNICGLAPTYTMLHVVKGSVEKGRLLHYGQTVDAVGNVVSFGSAGFYSS